MYDSESCQTCIRLWLCVVQYVTPPSQKIVWLQWTTPVVYDYCYIWIVFSITVTYGWAKCYAEVPKRGWGGAFTNFSVFLMHSSMHFFAFGPWNPSLLGALRLIWDLSVEWFIIGFQNYLGKLHDRTPFALIRILFVRITRLKILLKKNPEILPEKDVQIRENIPRGCVQ